MATMTEAQRAAIGEQWAKILYLKRSREHKDRYDTTWGDKTALGIFETVTRLVTDSQHLAQTVCECADAGCPAHPGKGYCLTPATTELERIDMGFAGRDPLLMCDDCAADAMESGLFRDLGKISPANW